MVNKRDRINDIVKYLMSEGIDVNIAKNKAQGHKGFFRISKKNTDVYRIDIARGLSDDEILRTLIHEFSHYVHYKYSKDYSSLDFIFPEFDELMEEELLSVTVNSIPKEFAKLLFEQKELYKNEVRSLKDRIKFNNLNVTNFFNTICMEPLKYLIKYDRVLYNNKVYSIDNISKDFSFLSDNEIDCFKLKSYQRRIKKINSRISKINCYYNQKSELFARFCELYFYNYSEAIEKAPKISKLFEENIRKFNIIEFTTLYKLLKF